MRTPSTEAFWQGFKAATGSPQDDYVAVAFGDHPGMADGLADLIVRGIKRASAGLVQSYAAEGEPFPATGDHVMVLDGGGKPVCIYRSLEVRVGPLSSVDERFAWDEGEGDRTRDWWLSAHRDFFSREAERLGFSMHDDIETVFERFEVIWPPDVVAGAQSSR